MICPLCGRRKARRSCPALGRQICAVCCGSKRLVEIQCPADCGYLLSAQSHPPAVLQRRRERDVRFLYQLAHDLNAREHDLFLWFQALILKHRPDALPAVNDDDVAEAAGALAATYETASRGIIYEHQPSSLPAQRLLADLSAALDVLRKTTRVADRSAAVVLRRIEQGARAARAALDGGTEAYLDAIERMMTESASKRGAVTQDAGAAESPRLIIP